MRHPASQGNLRGSKDSRRVDHLQHRARFRHPWAVREIDHHTLDGLSSKWHQHQLSQAHLAQAWPSSSARQMIVENPCHLGDVNRDGDESGHRLSPLLSEALRMAYSLVFGSAAASAAASVEGLRVGYPGG